MDSLAGCLSFNLPEAQLRRLFCPMASGLARTSNASCRPASWAHGPFSVATSSLEDGFLVCPDQETLFYLNGYFRLDGRSLFESSRGRSLSHTLTKLLAGLHEQRPEMLRKLSGSYLLLLYDGRQSALHILTDRLASRQLFYANLPGVFLFATALRPLLRHPALDRALDLPALVEFLRFSMVLGDRTLYQAVKTLPPATLLTIDPDGLRLHRYCSLDFDESWGQPGPDYVHSLAQAFKETCDRLVSHPDRSALMLSGGLDSRMIAASVCASGKRIHAISFGGFENDEVRLARRVAGRCRFPFVFVKRSPACYREVLPRAVDLGDGLYSFHHAHLLGLGRQIRALGVDTLIHGWGLDVLFSASYQPKRLVRHLAGRSFYLLWPRPFQDENDVVQSLYAALAFRQDPLYSHLPAGPLREIWRAWPKLVIAALVEKSRRHAGDLHNRFDWVLLENFSRFRSFLYPLSVRSGFRERCPLYDNAVLDGYLSLPPRLRSCSRAYGRALALLSKPLACLPYSRTGTSIRAPEFIQSISYFLKPGLQTARLAFRHAVRRHPEYPAETFDSYPRLDVLFSHTALGEIARHRFAFSVLADLGLVNPHVLVEMLDRHLRGAADYAEHLAALLTLETWLSRWS